MMSKQVGRPPLPPEEHKLTISLSLSPDVYRKVKKYADEFDLPVSKVVNDCLEIYFREFGH